MKYFACLLILICSTSATIAQVSSSDEPGRTAERFEQTAEPLAQHGGIISLPGVIAPDGASAIGLRIVEIRVVGSSVFSDEELQAVYEKLLDTDAVLADVYSLAQELTAKYGDDGYVLSRAIIPPQELDPAAAVITIQIIEGYVDRVVWPTETGRFRDFFTDYAEQITSERPTNIDTVMRYLLLAGDLPGIDVTSRFEASSANENASTLIVEMTEKPVDAYAQLDNRGTEARGPWQYSAGATLNNVFGLHEALSVSLSGAVEGSELMQLSVGYRQVLTSEGLYAFVNANASKGEPGTAPLRALEFKSSSVAGELGLAVPLIRSRDRNLTISGLVFLSNSSGEMLGAPSSEDRLRGLRLRANFDFADELNGITQGNVTLSKGFEGLGSTLNTNLLASRENGQVDFTTIAGSISRLQPLGHGISVLLAAEGQYAFTPLLSPEECGYGGRDFGRALDPSEISGDSCVSLSAEIRFDPDLPNNPFEQTQLYGFIDYGRVFRIAPSLGTPVTERGASAGVGIRLGTDEFSADLSAAKPLMGRINDDWRFFLTASAHY